MRSLLPLLLTAFAALSLPGCGGSGSPPAEPLVVNTLEDLASPPSGTVSLRSALAAAASGQAIRFATDLDGGEIALTLVGAEHTVLKGEVMGIRDEPSGPVSYLEGYFERDYGRSALYARKDVVIDASALPNGVTVSWAGGVDDDARVLAVYGDLVLRNVTIRGGRSTAVDIATGDPEDQPWTLGRGGGVAVWGKARLERCTLYDNHCSGDFESSRDRGAFGGGLYADIVDLQDCVVCGNTILGGGAAGGGVFSVGGAEHEEEISSIARCAITGNRIAALFTYGAGVYSDGGGIGNAHRLVVTNTTVARNVVTTPPGTPAFLLGIGYWRGGGLYMSNGYMELQGCTVVENEVTGMPRTDDLGKANLAGGIAATIGNAHAVEDLILGHSIVAGNVVHELGMDGLVANTYDHDIFSGSLLYFRSLGYNRIGVLDFDQILVPVGEVNWRSLCRKHYPKQDDEDGVAVGDVLDLVAGVTTAPGLLSAGVDPGGACPLHYAPQGSALDRVPTSSYTVLETLAEYDIDDGATDDFLAILLARIEAHHGLAGFAAATTATFETYLQTVDTDEDMPGPQPHLDDVGDPILTLADTHWFGPAATWPKELENYAWIQFWHLLDDLLAAEGIPGMGPELLGDGAWAAMFSTGPLTENPAITMLVTTLPRGVITLLPDDQLGTARPAGTQGDIGAREVP